MLRTLAPFFMAKSIPAMRWALDVYPFSSMTLTEMMGLDVAELGFTPRGFTAPYEIRAS